MPKTKLAKVSLTPKGAWDSTTAYEQLDLVSYDGGSWVAKKPSTGVTPRENDCWMKAAEKGEKGDQGAAGDTTETAKASYIVPRNTVSYIDSNVMALSPWAAGNKFAFIPPEYVVVEETTDGGVTWTAQTLSDTTKQNVFGADWNNLLNIKIPLLNGSQNSLCGVRITFTAYTYNVPAGTTDADRVSYWTVDNVTGYTRNTSVDGMFFWVCSMNNKIDLTMQMATLGNPTNWVTITTGTLAGWDGGNFVGVGSVRFGGYASNTSNYALCRLIFFTERDRPSDTMPMYISHISAFGNKLHGEYHDAILATGRLYSIEGNKNATFPADLTVTGDLNVKGNIVPNSYKLIETITLTDDTTSGIIRTAKPDGTAYKFSKVIIIASAKLVTDLSGNFGCSFIDSSGTAVGGNFIGSISANQDFRLYVASFAIENGVLFGRMGNFASGTTYNYQDFNTLETVNSYFFGGAAITIDQAKLAYLNDIVQIRINQFNTRPFASGSVFKIYAVDA